MALPLKAQEPESLYGTSHDRALDSVLYSMKKRRPVTSLDTGESPRMGRTLSYCYGHAIL